MENNNKYIGFSYFKNILKIKNINFEFNTIFSEYKKKDTDFNYYFSYNDKNILDNSLVNLIFLLKNFEKEFFVLNGFTIKEILKTIDVSEFINAIENKPNSEFLRKIGVLLEKFLEINIKLPEDSIIKKSYINILNKDIFITNEDKICLDKKFKIIDNSLGEFGKFNPIIIKEQLNKKIFTYNFNENLENINSDFDKEIIDKAINYLYTKETKGSLEIEGEKFSQSKNRGFLKLISNVPLKDEISKEDIIKIYNIIYDDNLDNYRTKQNYIGSGNGMMGENIIEFIPPKSDDLDDLMDNLIKFYNKNKNHLNPILLATILSTGFVLIHPFIDGNGRTSRFLLQFSLLNSGIGFLGDKKIILPVSAYISLNKNNYYSNLEKISGKLLDFIDFEEKDNGVIKVLNETKNVYVNLDFTTISNYFFDILLESINIDYKRELNYINKFYKLFTFIDDNYNISSNNISFIVKNILSNNGVLSESKKNTLEKKGVKLQTLENIENNLKNTEI